MAEGGTNTMYVELLIPMGWWARKNTELLGHIGLLARVNPEILCGTLAILANQLSSYVAITPRTGTVASGSNLHFF